jgi:hypothetical protein
MGKPLARRKAHEMGRRRQERDAALWDDDAFRVRAARIARSQGRPMSEVLETAGLGRSYFNRPPKVGGRSITSIIRLARSLDVSVNDLIEDPCVTRPPGFGPSKSE